MLKPRLDILPEAQRRLWPSLARLPPHFTLYGGTAIALRLGHRESVDFDFFSEIELGEADKEMLIDRVAPTGVEVLQNDLNTLTLTVGLKTWRVRLSFFGGIKNGCVAPPERTSDDIACVASPQDLLAHKLKVIHDRAEGKDYEDIAAMLAAGARLDFGLASREALFGSAVPAIVTLKALAYFEDVNEPWRLTEAMKSTIRHAMERLPDQLPKMEIHSRSLGCGVRAQS